jgi:ribosomal protein S27AE
MDDRTAGALRGFVRAAFIATWVILPIVGFPASRRMNAVAKRRWCPRWIVLIGILFVFFSTTLTVLESRSWSSLGILFLEVPAVILISYLNIKSTKFCDKCSATLFNHNWFTPMRFCSKCGAELDSVRPEHDDRFLE